MRRGGGIGRTAVFGLSSLLVLVTYGIANAAPAGYKTLVNRGVVPGVRYIKLKNLLVPNLVYILRVDLSEPIRFAPGLAHRRYGYERTSSMVARYGAVAGVNGDFTGGRALGGRPAHDFAQKGTFKFSSQAPTSANVAVSRDESTSYIGPTARDIDLWVRGSPEPLRIARWNAGLPATGQSAAFTRDRKIPDADLCSVRLRKDGPPVWSSKHQAVSRPYRVRKHVCGRILDPYRGVTLAAQPGSPQADSLQALGHKRIHVSWTVGWPHVWSTIGGFPVLVKDRKVVAPATCPSYFCGRNPRTGVGFTGKGKLLLIVVDGRSTASRGMRLTQFGHLFISLGAVKALNMDGGGSSTMVVEGKVKNHPSDTTGERAVTSSILLMRQPSPVTALGPESSRSELRGGGHPEAALTDPGSTGGLLDALATGAFGPTRLDPASREIVARYRRALGQG
jgi:hypothetical protein